MIAGLVIFPPLGIFLAWKHKLWTQQMRTIASVASGAWFVVMIVMGQIQKREKAEKEAAIAEQTRKDEEEQKERDAKVATAVAEEQKRAADVAAEAKRKRDAEAVAKAAAAKAETPPTLTPEKAIAPRTPELLCGAMDFTSFKGGVLSCSVEEEAMGNLKTYTISGHTKLGELAEGFDSMPELRSITLVEIAIVEDARGNPQKVKVAEFKLSRATAKKISWDNVKWRNIPKIIDYAWAKPGVPYLVDG